MGCGYKRKETSQQLYIFLVPHSAMVYGYTRDNKCDPSSVHCTIIKVKLYDPKHVILVTKISETDFFQHSAAFKVMLEP